MNTRCKYALMAILLAASLGPQLASNAHAYTVAGDHVLTGELVATDAVHNRFRIVGHGGSFTAPAGTSVEALDGKPVVVEFAGDGRVVQISQKIVHIDPITRSYEIVSGQLAVNDAVRRAFSFAGDSRVYIAPPGVDIESYAGRMVEVRLDEQGRVMDIGVAKHLGGIPLGSNCSYEGYGYADGAALCQSGRQYRCEAGTWQSLGLACTALSTEPCTVNGVSYADGAMRCERGMQFLCEGGHWRNLGNTCTSDNTAALRWARTCLLGDATVASGSMVCRSGTTFRCANGEWVSVGTACS